MKHNQRLGRTGEDAAAAWYHNAGYAILERNWRCDEGELDLIVAHADGVVFVEVKTRSSSRYGSGVDAVDWRKQLKLRRLAQRWLQEADTFYRDLRFDVADCDSRGHLVVYEDCF